MFDSIKGASQELFIARPDAAKGLLVYKHRDPTIPNHAQLTVGQDEVALFFKDGVFAGRLDAGRHTLASDNIPFLSPLIDKFTAGNMFRAEVWFVTTREVGGMQFGGQIGDMEDPKSGLAVLTMVYGDFSIRADDPMKVIAFFGQRSWSSDEEFVGWFKSQLLKVFRDHIAELMVKQKTPLLDVTSGAMNAEIEQVVLELVKPQLVDYGMRVVRLGNFVVSIKDEDDATLKSFYRDTAQLRMAGANQANMAAFQQYSAGKAMMGAGEGMARGGDGGGGPVIAGAGLGVGLGMAQMFQQQQAAAPAPAVQLVTCAKCAAHVAPGKFCSECGAELVAERHFCSGCGQQLQPGAKFCPGCGARA